MAHTFCIKNQNVENSDEYSGINYSTVVILITDYILWIILQPSNNYLGRFSFIEFAS
jgi:hypothetical protein